MRVLLAAMRSEKGDLDANLAAHIARLHEARRAGCHLAVFPEFSLTGYIDPDRRPDAVITLDHPAVEALVAASDAAGVGVVFGIAERAAPSAVGGPGGPVHISQVYALDGRLLGEQRKRHLGEGEEAFAAHPDTAVVTFGSARLGTIICAESTVDHTWAATAAAGAQVVFMTSAPGLDGRCHTEADWRKGFDWWDSSGLGDARRHAARHGVWVAMATQAGATADEDFPGIAALVDPQGEVAARLPDWREGNLVVDIPVPIEVEPVRHSVRVLTIDDAGRTLLAQFGDDRTGKRWWVPPGGGIDGDEDDETCARRELREELGRDDIEIGPAIGWRRDTFFHRDRGWFTQHERWRVARTAPFTVAPAIVAAVRAEGIRDLRWWTSEELRTEAANTGPRDLADLLDAVNAGRLPPPTTDLGR